MVGTSDCWPLPQPMCLPGTVQRPNTAAFSDGVPRRPSGVFLFVSRSKCASPPGLRWSGEEAEGAVKSGCQRQYWWLEQTLVGQGPAFLERLRAVGGEQKYNRQPSRSHVPTRDPIHPCPTRPPPPLSPSLWQWLRSPSGYSLSVDKMCPCGPLRRHPPSTTPH